MRKLVSALSLAATAAVLALPSTASAYNDAYCSSTYLTRGDQGSVYDNTCFGYTRHTINRMVGSSTGSAATCVGSAYEVYGTTADGPFCGGAGVPVDSGYFGGKVQATYPGLHNHSTFASRFNGTYYW